MMRTQAANDAVHQARSSIVYACDLQGTPITGFDLQIAAIGQFHHATLATRNERDFVGVVIRLMNPWAMPTSPRVLRVHQSTASWTREPVTKPGATATDEL